MAVERIKLDLAGTDRMGKEIEEKITRAKTALVLDHPLFGHLILRLKAIESYNFPTMATDGIRLEYNPEFVAKITKDGIAPLVGVLAHEAWHCACGHYSKIREGHRDHFVWNIAQDYVVNLVVTDSKLKLPEGCLLDEKYRNMSAEAVYDELCKELEKQIKERRGGGKDEGKDDKESGSEGGDKKPDETTKDDTKEEEGEGKGADEGDEENGAAKGKGEGEDGESEGDSGEGDSGESDDEGNASESKPGSGSEGDSELKEAAKKMIPGLGSDEDPGGCGGVKEPTTTEGTPIPESDLKDLERDWTVATNQAVQAAKSCGNLPGSLARMAEEIMNPPLNWLTILSRFVETTAKNDYRWNPPNKRYINDGIYLPSIRSESLGEVVVIVDTSGSIGNRELACFSSGILGLLQMYDVTLHVLSVDCRLNKVDTYVSTDMPSKLKPLPGGGGTDFRPGFKWIEDEGVNPTCLVYLTDGCCWHYPKAPDYPVLWVGTKDFEPPFGEFVRMYVDE